MKQGLTKVLCPSRSQGRRRRRRERRKSSGRTVVSHVKQCIVRLTLAEDLAETLTWCGVEVNNNNKSTWRIEDKRFDNIHFDSVTGTMSLRMGVDHSSQSITKRTAELQFHFRRQLMRGTTLQDDSDTSYDSLATCTRVLKSHKLQTDRLTTSSLSPRRY